MAAIRIGDRKAEQSLLKRMSKMRQFSTWPRSILPKMADEIDGLQITSVKLDGRDGLIVTFSDQTTGAYAVEELLGLRVLREPVKESKSQNLAQVPATQS
jgi:hypothetical protein